VTRLRQSENGNGGEAGEEYSGQAQFGSLFWRWRRWELPIWTPQGGAGIDIVRTIRQSKGAVAAGILVVTAGALVAACSSGTPPRWSIGTYDPTSSMTAGSRGSPPSPDWLRQALALLAGEFK
jgi:hypothetical protein